MALKTEGIGTMPSEHGLHEAERGYEFESRVAGDRSRAEPVSNRREFLQTTSLVVAGGLLGAMTPWSHAFATPKMRVLPLSGGGYKKLVVDKTHTLFEQRYSFDIAKGHDGYIVQLIKRDLSLTRPNPLPRNKISQAHYYELWQVVNGVAYPYYAAETSSYCSPQGKLVGLGHADADIGFMGGKLVFKSPHKDFANQQYLARKSGEQAWKADADKLANLGCLPPENSWHDKFSVKNKFSMQKKGVDLKGTWRLEGKLWLFEKSDRWLDDFFSKGAKRGVVNSAGVLVSLEGSQIKPPSRSADATNSHSGKFTIRDHETKDSSKP